MGWGGCIAPTDPDADAVRRIPDNLRRSAATCSRRPVGSPFLPLVSWAGQLRSESPRVYSEPHHPFPYLGDHHGLFHCCGEQQHIRQPDRCEMSAASKSVIHCRDFGSDRAHNEGSVRRKSKLRRDVGSPVRHCAMQRGVKHSEALAMRYVRANHGLALCAGSPRGSRPRALGDIPPRLLIEPERLSQKPGCRSACSAHVRSGPGAKRAARRSGGAVRGSRHPVERHCRGSHHVTFSSSAGENPA